MTNVVVVKQKKVVVTNNANTQQGIDYVRPITIKNTLGFSTQSNRLDKLNDVVEASPTEGDTLVYDAANDKYVVKKLALSEIDIDVALDGGTF